MIVTYTINLVIIMQVKTKTKAQFIFCLRLYIAIPDIPAVVNVLMVTAYSAPGCRPEIMA